MNCSVVRSNLGVSVCKWLECAREKNRKISGRCDLKFQLGKKENICACSFFPKQRVSLCFVLLFVICHCVKCLLTPSPRFVVLRAFFFLAGEGLCTVHVIFHLHVLQLSYLTQAEIKLYVSVSR